MSMRWLDVNDRSNVFWLYAKLVLRWEKHFILGDNLRGFLYLEKTPGEYLCVIFDSLTFEKNVKVMSYNAAEYVIWWLFLWSTRWMKKWPIYLKPFRVFHQRDIQAHGQAYSSWRRQCKCVAYHLKTVPRKCWKCWSPQPASRERMKRSGHTV